MCLSSLLSITTSARKRKWPLAIAVIVAVTGMAYSLLWPPVVRHDVVRYSSHPLFHTALSRYLERIHPVAHYWYWVTPGDIWGTLRASQTIGWGYLGGHIFSARCVPAATRHAVHPASDRQGHSSVSPPSKLSPPSIQAISVGDTRALRDAAFSGGSVWD